MIEEIYIELFSLKMFIKGFISLCKFKFALKRSHFFKTRRTRPKRNLDIFSIKVIRRLTWYGGVELIRILKFKLNAYRKKNGKTRVTQWKMFKKKRIGLIQWVKKYCLN